MSEDKIIYSLYAVEELLRAASLAVIDDSIACFIEIVQYPANVFIHRCDTG